MHSRMPRGNSESLYFTQQSWVCINIPQLYISRIWGGMQGEKLWFKIHLKMPAQLMDQRTDDV